VQFTASTHPKIMSGSHLRLVTPATKKRTVVPRRLPNSALRTREYLTESEVERLIAAAKVNRWGHRDSTMLLLAFRHGLRASELTDLRWDQIDFETATLHVRRVKQGTPSSQPIPGDELHSIAASRSPVMGFMDRVAPVVDETIRTLSNVRFVEDPIAGTKYSRATSIISSAYKRHGRILEVALRESLRESNRHSVWNDDKFRVSREADALANTQDLESCLATTLSYGNSVRTLQIDMIAFDSAGQFIRAYEIKRGNGQFDAGKIRSITRDLKCVQVLLRSYGELCKYKPVAAESKIIFYYGVRSIPRPWSLVGNELDEHFGFPVRERIEEANDYFRRKLHDLLEAS